MPEEQPQSAPEQKKEDSYETSSQQVVIVLNQNSNQQNLENQTTIQYYCVQSTSSNRGPRPQLVVPPQISSPKPSQSSSL